MDFIASVCAYRKIDFLWRPYLRDPDDDLVLEVAVAGQVDAIVTYNQKDFAGSDKFGIGVLSPLQFVKATKL